MVDSGIFQSLLDGFWLMEEWKKQRRLLEKSHGKHFCFHNVLTFSLSVNGRDLPASFRLKPPATKDTGTGPKQRGSSLGFLQLFMWPNLRKKTLILYYMWFSTALIYYGLTLNSNTLGTDLFTTFSIGKVNMDQ